MSQDRPLAELGWEELNSAIFPGHNPDDCAICDAVRVEILRRVETEEDP